MNLADIIHENVRPIELELRTMIFFFAPRDVKRK